MTRRRAGRLLREIAAQFERPVLPYSIGEDSSVLVHLARKASSSKNCGTHAIPSARAA